MTSILPDPVIERIKSRSSLRQIEIICTAVRLGSITEAARNLNMSVANVSRTLKRFELHFEFSVFEKTRKGISLSPEGELIFIEMNKLNDGIASVFGSHDGPSEIRG